MIYDGIRNGICVLQANLKIKDQNYHEPGLFK